MNTLKSKRLKFGLNMKEFSEALGVPYRTYQDWERGTGKKMPNLVFYCVDLLYAKIEDLGLGCFLALPKDGKIKWIKEILEHG